MGSKRNATTDEAHLSAATVTDEIKKVATRPVSRAEALRIAHGILKRAERERLTLAENEARRGIEWDDA